jgi:hypothetical protein
VSDRMNNYDLLGEDMTLLLSVQCTVNCVPPVLTLPQQSTVESRILVSCRRTSVVIRAERGPSTKLSAVGHTDALVSVLRTYQNRPR